MLNFVTQKKRKLFTLADLVVVGLVLLCFFCAVFSFFIGHNKEAVYAEVKIYGKLYERINLSEVTEAYDMPVDGDIPVVLRISSEGVCFESSDCPDKLCVKRGVISKNGESAICLPAAVSVKIVSSETSEIDAVVG